MIQRELGVIYMTPLNYLDLALVLLGQKLNNVTEAYQKFITLINTNLKILE